MALKSLQTLSHHLLLFAPVQDVVNLSLHKSYVITEVPTITPRAQNVTYAFAARVLPRAAVMIMVNVYGVIHLANSTQATLCLQFVLELLNREMVFRLKKMLPIPCRPNTNVIVLLVLRFPNSLTDVLQAIPLL